jgi:hypothetical protein
MRPPESAAIPLQYRGFPWRSAQHPGPIGMAGRDSGTLPGRWYGRLRVSKPMKRPELFQAIASGLEINATAVR